MAERSSDPIFDVVGQDYASECGTGDCNPIRALLLNTPPGASERNLAYLVCRGLRDMTPEERIEVIAANPTSVDQQVCDVRVEFIPL